MPGRFRLRRLHRWLGIVAFAFLAFLSITGVALNHSSALELDRHYVTAPWLLGWYGLEMPFPAASFEAGGSRITLVGERLFVDATPAIGSVRDVFGAATVGGYIMAATSSELLVLSESADILDRVPWLALVDAPVVAIGRGANPNLLLVQTADRVLGLDSNTLAPIDESAGIADSQWSAPTPAPADLLERIERAYLGDGIALERLVYDLHSGRIAERLGVWLMDLVGVLILILSFTGLLLWMRPRGR